MSERTFLIQRYCTGNWPLVRGEYPFLATGPAFEQWGYGLTRYNEWRFVSDLGRQFQDAYGQFEDCGEARYYAAWALLDTSIVQALWSGHSPIPQEEWWSLAVEQLAREIPSGPIGESVIEYLSGLSSPGHFRSYVAEDQIELVPMPCLTS